jgi:hypothetical protein
VTHRDQGPAAAVTGNTTKDARSGRGCGIFGDRADIIYEVRDVTGFTPSGTRYWVEELPPASRADWAVQNRRRKGRKRYRLAFFCTGKFRGGEVPAPFVLEVRHDTDPWEVVDVTADLIRAGEDAAQAARAVAAAVIEKACQTFEAALRERELNQERAEQIFRDAGVTRAAARSLLKQHVGTRWARDLVKGRRGGRAGEQVIYHPLKTPDTAAIQGSETPHPEQGKEAPIGADRMDRARHQSTPPNHATDAGPRQGVLPPNPALLPTAGAESAAVPDPCPTCHSRRFWVSDAGQVVCGRCHPQTAAEVVAGQEADGGDSSPAEPEPGWVTETERETEP